MIYTSGPNLGLFSNLAGDTGCILLSSTSASLETLCDANPRRLWVHLVKEMERKKPLFVARVWDKHIKEHECSEKYYVAVVSKTRANLPLMNLCFTNRLTSLTLQISSVTSFGVSAGPRVMWWCREKFHQKEHFLVSFPLLVALWHLPLTPSFCSETAPGPSRQLGKHEIN